MRFATFPDPLRRGPEIRLGGWLGVLLGVVFTAGPGSAGEFEFITIGDTRPRFESQDFRPFEGLIERINAAKPALVVNVGDLIFGYGPHRKERQWDRYQQVIRAVSPPYYQVPGNHDTHSKEARRLYERRFGKGYRSFDYQDCHFVLLDNTEKQRWGYLGPEQLDWLKADLRRSQARTVFVFMHFPVWEPERITPAYHEFWAKTLHPLFRQSRVRAVFGGHYHTYGPTREFDGIRYFITGGGGAELIPEYKKSGGEHHFMKVKVSGETFDVRVVTDRGELTDAEADVMGGLLFAARNVSRIGIKHGLEALNKGVEFSVSIENPYQETLTGRAKWLFDASAFAVEPQEVSLQIPESRRQEQKFTLKALTDSASLQSLPRLEFNVMAGGRRHRFHREVRFLEELRAPRRRAGPVLDGQLTEWADTPWLRLGQDPQQGAELRACCDEATLYLAVVVPVAKAEEAEELGFKDDLQIGMAHRLSDTDFGANFLRLGLSCGTPEAGNRTPGRKTDGAVPGVRSICRKEAERMSYEIAVPLQLLKSLKAGRESQLILDLSFPVPDGVAEAVQPREPGVNTFAYRVRYGSDSLVPVYYIELTIDRKNE